MLSKTLLLVVIAFMATQKMATARELRREPATLNGTIVNSTLQQPNITVAPVNGKHVDGPKPDRKGQRAAASELNCTLVMEIF